MEDFEKALKMAHEAINDTIEYFDGNEINEALVDPYLMVATISLQTQKIEEAVLYIKKAESVV